MLRLLCLMEQLGVRTWGHLSTLDHTPETRSWFQVLLTQNCIILLILRQFVRCIPSTRPLVMDITVNRLRTQVLPSLWHTAYPSSVKEYHPLRTEIRTPSLWHMAYLSSVKEYHPSRTEIRTQIERSWAALS